MFSQKLYDKSKLKIKTTIQFDKLKIFEKQFFLHFMNMFKCLSKN